MLSAVVWTEIEEGEVRGGVGKSVVEARSGVEWRILVDDVFLGIDGGTAEGSSE